MPLLSTFGAASARSFGGIGAAAAGAGLDVDEVFSTFVYNGSSSSQTFNNGIDLSGEGGLVWIKERSSSGSDHHLTDTVRGIKNPLNSDSTAAENAYYANNNQGITAFNNNGFTVASGSNFNDNGDTAVSWTFRKAPKFFDVVIYSGNSTAGRTISHNLGSVPGMIIVKSRTDGTEDWCVYHRGIASDAETDCLFLNLTDTALDNDAFWNDTAPTSTQFTLGNSTKTNRTGHDFVAYLFAHNDSDGGFGPDGDQDIIKCGSYTGNSGNPQLIELGFEPQFLMVKCTTNSGNWFVVDNMRGVLPNADYGNDNRTIYWNKSDAEIASGNFGFYSTGFAAAQSSTTNGSGRKFIYMAIRRGPLAIPEDATKVFAIDSQGSTGDGNAPSFRSNFPVDMAIRLDTSGASKDISARLTGAKRLYTDLTNAESSFNNSKWDYQNGWYSATSTITNYYAHMWKRAPSYFDVVAYTGDSTSKQDINHNLGVAPEMIWIKNRDQTGYNWIIGTDELGGWNYYVSFNSTSQRASSTAYFGNTAPTSSQFSVGQTAGQDDTNRTTYKYIAYLFASVSGVSKIGSYTGNGSTQTIDCGFNPRFILTKKIINGNGNWFVFDTKRGIVAGNDPYLLLNTTDAEVTNVDTIDPTTNGFIVNDNNTNANSDTYLFYAIA